MLLEDWYIKSCNKINKFDNKYISDLNLIIYDVLNKNKIELLNYKLSEKEVRSLNDRLDEYVMNPKPIAYQLGFEIFLNEKIIVNEHTLIPRFETEELVLLMKDEIKQMDTKKLRILDLCSGTGVIGVSIYNELKDLFDIHVDFIDISSEALMVTKKNVDNFGLIKFNIIESDLLSEVRKTGYKYDIIISNPPYISFDDENVEESVEKYEPHLALFAKENGLKLYRKIIEDLRYVLKDGAIVAFEIGHKQANDINKMAKEHLNQEFKIKKDISGRDRILILHYGVL